MDGQGTKWRRKTIEKFNRLSRVHDRDDRQTNGRQHIPNVNVSSCPLKINNVIHQNVTD